MADKPVLIQYPEDHHLRGAMYVVKNPQSVAEMHPDATILMYEDGSPFEGKQPSETAKAEKARANAENAVPHMVEAKTIAEFKPDVENAAADAKAASKKD